MNAHHDTGFLTILSQGSVPGLQVQNPAGDWIDVPRVPGSLVVNLGESLQAMTGNYLVATPHRVISELERYSTAHFYGPSWRRRWTRCLGEHSPPVWRRVPTNANAGFMARKDKTEAGVGGWPATTPSTYGEHSGTT